MVKYYAMNFTAERKFCRVNKLRKVVSALLCTVLILLSVFSDAGLSVRAQAVEYLNSLDIKTELKDDGTTVYGTVGTNNAIVGISGAQYSNGIAIALTRDSSDKKSFAALTYTIPNEAASFAAYVDLDKTSGNTANFNVRMDIYTDDTVAYSQTLTPSTEYPVMLNVAVGSAEEITIRLGDTAENSGITAFVLGNAALCETGSTIPSVTVPDNEPSSGNDTPSADLDVSADELKAKSKEYLGHNYLFVTMQLSWAQAATWCEMQGGYLATIESEAENKFISDYLKSLGNKTAYFGLQNTANGSVLKWQNGETAKYFNWGRQSVTDANAQYMMMGGGSDEWTLGAANEQYLNFVIEWGEKEVLVETEDNPNEKAVIVIAGLGGSVLSDSDGNLAWADRSGSYTELDLSDIMLNEEYTPAGSNYGVSDVYKDMLEGISAVCSDSDVMLYEWDWRGSAMDAADGLKKLIEEGGWNDVSLVGHNTGGLAALYYIGENDTEGISKIITLGTPFYGTEKAFYMIKSGMFAQGTDSVKGILYDSTSKLEALHSMIPDAPNAGAESFTGKIINSLTKENLFESVQITRTDSDSALLKNVYKMISEGKFGGMYIIAGTGAVTLESIALNENGDITGVGASLDGDGLTDVRSAAMNFESARPPYIIEDTNSIELVTSEDSIKLVCNILSGLADTAGFADGVSRRVSRNDYASDAELTEISISGNAKLTVQTDGSTVTLSDSGYTFSGDSSYGYMYGDIKTVFVTDDAQINIELLGSRVCLEISGNNGTAAWSDIALGSGAVLKATVDSDTLEVVTDPHSTGITEIKADTVALAPKPEQEEITEETEEHKKLVISWNVWVAIGLIIAAAAVALMLMPYLAYRISKVETDRRKRALKQELRRRRQQRARRGAPPSRSMADIPALPSSPDGTVKFDITDILSGDSDIDFDFLSNN